MMYEHAGCSKVAALVGKKHFLLEISIRSEISIPLCTLVH